MKGGGEEGREEKRRREERKGEKRIEEKRRKEEMRREEEGRVLAAECVGAATVPETNFTKLKIQKLSQSNIYTCIDVAINSACYYSLKTNAKASTSITGHGYKKQRNELQKIYNKKIGWQLFTKPHKILFSFLKTHRLQNAYVQDALTWKITPKYSLW